MDIKKFTVKVNLTKCKDALRVSLRVPSSTAKLIGPVYFTGQFESGLRITPCTNGGKDWSGTPSSPSRVLSIGSHFFKSRVTTTTHPVELTALRQEDGSYVLKPFDIKTAPSRKASKRRTWKAQKSLPLQAPVHELKVHPQNVANALLRSMQNAYMDPTISMDYDGKPFDASKLEIFAVERTRLV